MSSPNLTNPNILGSPSVAERRKSHVANMDFSQVQPPGNSRNLGRRSSLSPLIISQLSPYKLGDKRGGSFRQSDRRFSHETGHTIGVQQNALPRVENNIPEGWYLTLVVDR